MTIKNIPVLIATNTSYDIKIDATSKNLIPVDNETYDLGSSSLEWNNVYTENMSVAGNFQRSDRRIKQNIFDLKEGLSFITRIRPVEYTYKNRNNNGNTGDLSPKKFVRHLVVIIILYGDTKRKQNSKNSISHQVNF
jgi:hypothetical protein